MEKVKLTQEQANGIESMREMWSDESLIRTHSDSPNMWAGPNAENLNGMPLLTLVDALRIGYEVEPKYKAGDWVSKENGEAFKYSTGGFAKEVKAVHKNNVELVDAEGTFGFDFLRRATPEEIKAEQERRVWSGIGREVGEFRVGDGYLYDTNALYNIDCEQRIRVVREAYDGDKLVGFYPAESFISFGGESHDN